MARQDRVRKVLQYPGDKYRDYFENATEGIFQAGGDGRRFLSANPALAHLHGYRTPAELVDSVQNIAELFVDATRYEELVRLLRERSRVIDFEVQMRRKDGSICWISTDVRAISDHDGKVLLFEGTMRDITQRKEAEEALQAAEQKYRDIFENATEGIFQIGRDGRFLSANPALARLHGHASPGTLMGEVRHVRDDLFISPDDHGRLLTLLKKHGRVQNFEVRMKRKDGSVHWISINVRTVYDKQGKVAFHEGTMRSISKRKAAEEALAESEKRYRTVIERSNDGIAIAHKGKHEYVNQRFVEMFGYGSPDEVVGHPITQIVHPDDVERVMNIHARRWRGEPVPHRYEFRGVTRSGATIYIEVSSAGITYRNHPVLLVFLRDMTERKHAEELLLQSHRQLEQLNSVKTKAVNHISHELKTPLAVIQGNIRLIRRKLEETPLNEQVKVIMETTEKNLERLFRMQKEADEILRTSGELEAGNLLDEIDRLKERMADLSEAPPEVDLCWDSLKRWVGTHMSGTGEGFQSLDLYPLLLQSIAKARHLAAHRDVDLRVEGVNDVYVLMDPAIVRDIFDGLLRNAIENTPDGGFVSVSLEEKDDGVTVHVTDSGVGIAEEHQPYIFDGLFHAKETELYASKQQYDFDAGGKGLDLLRMKRYAERFGFDLSVKSTRCGYIPGDTDVCPGSIAHCSYCRVPEDCYRSGGTTFSVSFLKNRPGQELSPTV
jgi:PAS domain S-box-containing protein